VVEQPRGTVTLVFTDIEGSTRLLAELGQDAYREALARHRRVVREAFGRYSGYEVDYEGDAFFYAFASAQGAVSAVAEAMAGLQAGGLIRIRVGVHTGKPGLDPPKYVGLDVHKAARIMSAGHGGQVLLSKTTRDLVEIDATELGEHRLKDLDGPVPLYQVGDGQFPPLKTISNTNLPRPASTFVGRDQEVDQVASLIHQGARLVTLTGPGGTGKTRLAIEAASELVPHFKAGVFWVGLATLRDPTLVTETIAQTLGAKDGLADHIADRQLLLLLDNLEQVIDCAPNLSTLLSACPNLHLLVTSRELLRIQGETEYPVPPLADPDGLELFTTRAQTNTTDTIRQLCHRLDNLPLALELAASWASLLTPEELLERLSERLDLLEGGRDADPRQQTLRATIAWSHDLLTDDEKTLFARLAVFAGGSTLDAAQTIAAADLPTLKALLDKNLLRKTDDRYWMLETIREFALERLEDLPDADRTREAHAHYYLRLAREAEVGERGDQPVAWWDRLESELANLRAVFEWAEARGDVAVELELGSRLKRFWHARGHLREAKERLEDALARSADAPGLVRAYALRALVVTGFSGEADRVAIRKAAEEALSLFESAGDRAGIARATNDLGVDYSIAGELDRARALYEQTYELAQEAGDTRYMLIAMANLGDVAFIAGRHAEAVDHDRAAVGLARRTGEKIALTTCLINLAEALVGAGQPADAAAPAREALLLGFERKDDTVGYSLKLLAIIDAETGQPARSARLLGAALQLRDERGEGSPPIDELLLPRALEALHAALGSESVETLVAEGRRLTVEEAVALATEAT
jgi:predicted ATPase